MRRFFLSYTGTSLDWLVFIGILMLVCFVIAIFVVWYTVLRKPGKKRKRRHHHRRHHSPTLADLGGLPPRREEKNTDSPPPS